MQIKNIKLDSFCCGDKYIRVLFDIEYSNGDKSDGYVYYDTEGKITNHCSPSLYMGGGDYTDYYLDFAKVCERLKAFEGENAKALVDSISAIYSKYDDLETKLKDKYDYINVSKNIDTVEGKIIAYKSSLRRLKREDKIKDLSEKIDLALSELYVYRKKMEGYYSEIDALNEKKVIELKNIKVAL